MFDRGLNQLVMKRSANRSRTAMQVYILGTKFYILGTKFYILGTKFMVLGTTFQILGTKFMLLDSKFWEYKFRPYIQNAVIRPYSQNTKFRH